MVAPLKLAGVVEAPRRRGRREVKGLMYTCRVTLVIDMLVVRLLLGSMCYWRKRDGSSSSISRRYDVLCCVSVCMSVCN